MKNHQNDPIGRLRDADPMHRRLPDDASSPAAARVFERVGAPEAVLTAPQARDRRFRASRALPVLAAAAAAVAVVGLSLPKDAPAPVRSIVGSEQATASPDRPKLLRAAEEQEASGAAATPAEQQFLDGLSAYPEDPTPSNVLAWLDANCAAVTGAQAGDPSPGVDCGLLAAPIVVNEAPSAVSADVLRALATLDGGLPTHAERCTNWESEDPAWRDKVEQAEAGAIWVKRNGTLLVLNDPSAADAGTVIPAGGSEQLTQEARAQLQEDLASKRVAASVTKASAESNVVVQCKPTSELGNHPEQTVEGAMGAYAEDAEHDGCSLSPVEAEGLVAVDLAQVCQVGTADLPPVTGVEDGQTITVGD
jgi:hypothetical protein